MVAFLRHQGRAFVRRYFVTHASVRCARCGVKLSARILAPSAPHRLTRLIPRCSSPVGSELLGPGGCSSDDFIATMATYIIFRYFFFFPSVFDFDFRAGGPFFSTLCFRVVRVVSLSLAAWLYSCESNIYLTRLKSRVRLALGL